MAGLFDNIFGGGGGNMFGGNSLYADMLTPEQMAAVRNQSMMQVAAKLLESSGPSTTRRTLGQTLGSALGAGAEAMQSGQANAVQQMLTRQKLQEAKQAAAQRESWSKMFGGGSAPATAAGAMTAPTETAGRVGPTPQRADLMTTAPAPAAQQMFSMLTPEQRSIIQMLGPEAGAKELLGLTQAPTDVRAVEYILGRPLAGAGVDGIGQVGQYRQQIAPKTNVQNILPSGPNQFVQGAGAAAAENLNNAMAAANAANATLRNIDLIAPALDTAVVGPAADYRTSMLRVADQLGIAGQDAEQRLASTRQVLQGLARAEMDASQGMKGQGTITDSERVIIRRMSAGEQNMSAAELRTGMAAMQKLANERLQSYQGMLQTARGVQGFENVAPLYQINPYQSQFNLNNSLNLGNAVQQELDRRRQSGGAR
jgi:hypothetical protein